ncbi:MAG: S9 family peptidase [Gemmatimonadaceae bacterium]
MRTLIALASLALAAPLVAQAPAPKRPMTPDDVMALKGVSDAQISPDGRWVAYVVSAADFKENAYDANVWLVGAGGGDPVQLTRNVKNDNAPRWSPDGRRLAFLSNREENRGQIWLINPFGGEPERLTESKSGVQGYEWSPDGSRIAYVAAQEPTPDEEKKTKERDDPQRFDVDFRMGRLWVIDVATKKATEIVKGDFSVADPQWSPDGRTLAYVTYPTPKPDDGTRGDVWVVGADGQGARKLYENPSTDAAPRWSPDGRSIAVVTRLRDSSAVVGQAYLAIAPAAGGAPRPLTEGFLYQPSAAEWSADGRTIYFTAPTRTTTQLYAVPAAGGTPRAVSAVRGVMSAPTFSRAGQVAFTLSDPQHPNDVHVARLAGPFAPAKLTDHNPQVRALALGTAETIRWKGKDGMEIEGVVYYPPGYDRSRRYPLIANIHGGPSGVWNEAFPGSSGNAAHVWAGNGWVVFLPNVRGSSAYGEKFLAANVRDWGRGDFQDIQTGIDSLVARGVADPARLGQTGWSYGGYMTAWTLTQTDRFKAVMVGAGLTNMYSMYSTNDLQRTLDSYFGAEPWDDFDAYWNASAMKYIKQAKTPTLILHGANDQRVPVGQAQELFQGLKRNGVPVELVFYPREGHGFQEPRHQLDRMRREMAWFDRWVLGKAEATVSAKPSVVP